MGILKAIYLLVRASLVSRLGLAAENLALRQQVAIYKQSVKRPKLRLHDRFFWVLLSWFWSNWRSVLAIVRPAVSNRRPRAKSSPSRKSAVYTIGTHGAPRNP
jgi:hypothetical protein